MTRIRILYMVDKDKRKFLIASTTVIGSIGLAGATYSVIRYMGLSEKVKTLGGPITINYSKLKSGELLTGSWRGLPVWILRRTPEMLKKLEQDELKSRLRDPESLIESQQPKYTQNNVRSLKPEILVVIGICTHLGCIPKYKPTAGPGFKVENWPGGFFCPCHGSSFDLAGRVFKGVPAPTNLLIPPHRFLKAGLIRIGEDTIKKAS